MKKYLKIVLIIYLLIFMSMLDVKAQMYAINGDKEGYEEIPDFSFVLGTHMYTSLSKIDYLEIIDAADSAGDYDPIIYQKVGSWYSFDGQVAEIPNKDGLICISHIDGVQLEDGECVVKRYTVKFENESPSISEQVSITEGSKILANDVPTNLFKHGYKFVCWVDKENASEDPSENCFDFDSSITGDLTLIPYYEPITYTIKFDLNIDGGSETIENQICNIDSFGDCKLPTVKSVRKGYKFAGWSANNDEDSSNGTYYKAEESMIDLLGEENVVTLYAVWEPEEFTITYDLDGGTFDSSVIPKTTFTDLTKDNIKLFTPTRTGFTFERWDVEESSAGSVKKADESEDYTLSIVKLENVTVKAVWKEKEYTITYNLGVREDESLQTPQSTTCKFNTNCQLQKAPERKGYEFAGWTDNNGYLYVAGQDFKGVDFGSDSITLTAVWYNEFTSTITYNLDGGYFSTTPLSVVGKEQLESDLPKPEKLGYTFECWCKDEETETCESSNINKVKDALDDQETLKDVTLYAKWKANTYTIEFHESPLVMALMSSDGLESVECTYDEECNLTDHTEKFTEKSLKLKGWSYSYEENAKAYFSDNMNVMNLTTEAGGTVDLYAVTEEIPEAEYSLFIYLDGGNLTNYEDLTSKKHKASESITIGTPTKDNATFDKWVGVDGQQVEVSGGLTLTKDTVLIAKWNASSSG